ncbi:hemophore-related protein [Nocardia bovistercoris]|uniref:Hemophore-related protein n=1 Tax=Nocardia bovistercoris TaxID=2785916 RepID=A0A931N3E2_9NOCA|nr:hemophore-related protein [Nocardia bovistercoris]MBH0780530.1 hemophore-related protein [Nocardia bovistercoris]
MKRFRSRTAVAVFAAGAGASAVMFLGPAIAAADPTSYAAPLLNSDCTFAQVDAALHVEAPQLAAALDANPSQKAQLQAGFDQPVEQRKAQFQRLVEENPQAAQQAQNDPRAAQFQDAINRVAATCKNY